MDLAVLCLSALLLSALTLLSGFGLGTLLMPVFALFYPVQLAVAMTAVVHLLNNLLKVLLLGRFADRQVVIRFGLPAILAAFGGAWVLAQLSETTPLASYQLLGHEFQILPVKVVVGTLLILFTALELKKERGTPLFDRTYLPLGGAVSGFFGGLSGHQGALRSAFLVSCGLSKEAFLGSGVVVACLVDVGRLAVYGTAFPALMSGEHVYAMLAVIIFAFVGTWLGNELARKTTIRVIQVLVSLMVFGIGVGLASGML